MPGFTFGPRPAILPAMKRNLLRSRDGSHEERVGFVELFFDLVFVFAVTQVSHTLIVHPDPMGFLQAAILFVAIWWVWVETAWVTNWLDVSHIEVRLLLFALMGAALVMSISLPEAFGDRALVFALAYVAIQLGRHGFMLLALAEHNRDNFLNFVRIIIWALAEAPFWIVGALQHEAGARMALWGDRAGPAQFRPGRRLPRPRPGAQRDPDLGHRGPSFLRALRPVHHHRARRIDPRHRRGVRRHGLVVGDRRRFRQRLPRHARDVVALFRRRRRAGGAAARPGQGSGTDGAARLHLFPHSDRRRDHRHRRLRRDGGGPSGRPRLTAAIACLLGGPALYLFGNLIFKRTSTRYFPLSHMVGLGVLAAILPFAGRFSPLSLSLAATATLVLVAGWEWVSLRDTRRALRG